MIPLSIIAQGAKIIRSFRTSYKKRKEKKVGRLWLEKAVLRAGNFKGGDGIVVTSYEDYIHVRAALCVETPSHVLHQKKGEPILDLSNANINKVLGVNVVIDVIVKEQELYAFKQLTFDMIKIMSNSDNSFHPERLLRVISLFSGAGGMTAGFVEEGCESVMAVDIDTAANNPFSYAKRGRKPSYMAYTVETFCKNFPKTRFFYGDVRSVHPDYILEADLLIVSPPCLEYSNLGLKMEGIVEHFAQAIVRIALCSGIQAIFFENVPAYFTSKTFLWIKRMLAPLFKCWHQAKLDSWDFGTLDRRPRGYAIGTRTDTNFQFPKPEKKVTRKTLGDYLDNLEGRDWFDVAGSYMEKLLGLYNLKYAQTGFTAAHNSTLVGLDSQQINCITGGYLRRQVTQSYIKHPEKEKWSLLKPNEIQSILDYPTWFEFPDFVPKSHRYEILGNSVNVKMIKLIAANLVSSIRNNVNSLGLSY
ncbi:DNA cytosine methyltransferase [Paenibacillus sp. Leaf72]|uniref:DNA cytosine methyltransferase n=1 Tax=Paenibacillus sp. Leaf72 TaxID=1736234 RepID=UPI0007019766|nr:DNA cytosine methyltransferase [Paenibacillus sp. Leaf72]KQN96859.1 hypothetical protein ASF12_22585 [Paenibacillus sp. Leaf72]